MRMRINEVSRKTKISTRCRSIHPRKILSMSLINKTMVVSLSSCRILFVVLEEVVVQV